MTDWQQAASADYRQKGLAHRSGFGQIPVLLVVDFCNGFTDPDSPLGADFSAELEVTRVLQQAFRDRDLTVVYTTISFQPDLRDGGLFIRKVPALSVLVKGSDRVAIDKRIRPRFDEMVFSKQSASAFFATGLNEYLQSLGIDTVIMTGCTTSGCIRASAIDAMQYGYHTIVVVEGVGDRAKEPHEANLFDIDAKYADVLPANRVHDYLHSLGKTPNKSARRATRANPDNDFLHWWRNDEF